MISKEDLESCVTYIFKYKSLFEWFLNQDVVPFVDDYSELYQNFIKEVLSLYKKERKETFFISGVGLVSANYKKDIVSIDNFKIDINKINSLIRNKKLEQILNN